MVRHPPVTTLTDQRCPDSSPCRSAARQGRRYGASRPEARDNRRSDPGDRHAVRTDRPCRTGGTASRDAALLVTAVGAARDASGGMAGSRPDRSEEHTSELQSLMRISYAVFCLKKKK